MWLGDIKHKRWKLEPSLKPLSLCCGSMPSWHLCSAVLPGLSQGKALWEVLRRVWSQLGFPSLWMAPCALAMSNFLRVSHKRGPVDWWPYIVWIENRSVVMLSKLVNTYWNIFILDIERIWFGVPVCWPLPQDLDTPGTRTVEFSIKLFVLSSDADGWQVPMMDIYIYGYNIYIYI